MPIIQIQESELLKTVRTKIGTNGTISIGKAHAGKEITAYVIEVKS